MQNSMVIRTLMVFEATVDTSTPCAAVPDGCFARALTWRNNRFYSNGPYERSHHLSASEFHFEIFVLIILCT